METPVELLYLFNAFGGRINASRVWLFTRIQALSAIALMSLGNSIPPTVRIRLTCVVYGWTLTSVTDAHQLIWHKVLSASTPRLVPLWLDDRRQRGYESSPIVDEIRKRCSSSSGCLLWRVGFTIGVGVVRTQECDDYA